MVYIDLESTDVYENFGLEYYLAKEKNLEDTVFLFWRTTPTLMLGKYQNLAEEVNLPYARERGRHHLHGFGRLAVYLYRPLSGRGDRV